MKCFKDQVVENTKLYLERFLCEWFLIKKKFSLCYDTNESCDIKRVNGCVSKTKLVMSYNSC